MFRLKEAESLKVAKRRKVQNEEGGGASEEGGRTVGIDGDEEVINSSAIVYRFVFFILSLAQIPYTRPIIRTWHISLFIILYVQLPVTL